MDVDRILKLADVIETTPHKKYRITEPRRPLAGFNMGVFHCGTVGCIAGWAVYLFGSMEGLHISVAAEYALDLSRDQGDELFVPDDVDLQQVNPAQAAAVLRHLATTGEVDWAIQPQQAS